MYGESEVSFVKFLVELAKNKPNFSLVPNLIWAKIKNGQPIINPQEPPIYNLDSLPFPSYQSFEIKKYFGVSRCAYKCRGSYCILF